MMVLEQTTNKKAYTEFIVFQNSGEEVSGSTQSLTVFSSPADTIRFPHADIARAVTCLVCD